MTVPETEVKERSNDPPSVVVEAMKQFIRIYADMMERGDAPFLSGPEALRKTASGIRWKRDV